MREEPRLPPSRGCKTNPVPSPQQVMGGPVRCWTSLPHLMIAVILKFIWKEERAQISKTILKMINQVEGMTLPGFKTYIAKIIKTVILQRNRHIDQ